MSEHLQTIAGGIFPGWSVVVAATLAFLGLGSLAMRRAHGLAQCALGFSIAAFALCILFQADGLRHVGAAVSLLHAAGVGGILLRICDTAATRAEACGRAWTLAAFHAGLSALFLSALSASDAPRAVLEEAGFVVAAILFAACGFLALRASASRTLRASLPLFLVGLAAEFALRGTDGAAASGAAHALCLCGACGTLLCIVSASPDDFLRRRRLPLLLFTPLFAILSLGSLQLPGAWDECVYQLAIPRHWLAAGDVVFRRDIPYCGFPLLPQFVFVPLMKYGGFGAAKLLLFLGAVGFFSAMFALFSGKRERATGIVFVLSFLISPLALSMFAGGYVEPLLGFLLAAALLLVDRNGEPDLRTHCVLGVLAGAMASFKLNGAFPAACLLIRLILQSRGRTDARRVAAFCLTALAVAAPFYLRVILETGSPLHPYFGSAGAETSEYHHALGTEKFDHGVWWLPFLPFALSLPNLRRLYDGSFGLSLLPWLGVACLPLVRRGMRKAALCAWIPLAAYALLWFFTSPQARFLLPSLAFLALAVRPVAAWLSGRGKVFLAATLICAACSVPPDAPRLYASNWAALLRGGDGPLETLNGRIGNDHLALCDVLRQGAGGEGTILLLGEERTLYLPERCEVGTPFFQEKWLAGGRIPDADELHRLFLERGVTAVYLRLPEGNPDLLPRYAIRWLEPAALRMNELCASGRAKIVHAFGKSALYRIVPLEKNADAE